MHVLFLTKWYPGRNDPQLGEFIRKQALAVNGLATTSVIFTHPVEEQTQELLIDRNLSDGLLEFRAYYRKDDSKNPLVRKIKNFRSLQKAFKTALEELINERGHPDISHVHILTRPLLPALYLKRKKKIPFLVSEQSSVYLDGTFERKSFLHKAFDRWGMKKAARHTAVSPYLSEAMRKLGLGREFAIVPNVLPLDKYGLAPQGQPGHFLMVADLVDKIKNVSGVLYAVESIAKTHPEIRLDIIGDGVDREKLEDLRTELNITEQVSFLGRLPNVEVLKHMSKVGSVVINSRVETFSVVTGEALMLGKPVVATRCGGPIALVNADNGLLVPVDDRGALETAMRKITEEHGSYEPQKVRDSVGERTSAESVGKAFMKIYEEILQ